MLVTFLQAWRGLTSKPARTLLTTLGIIIGIATVVLVISAGEGFKGFINAQLDSFGSNFITVQTQVPPTTRARAGGFGGVSGSGASQAVQITSLKNRDVENIAQINGVKGVYGAVIGQKVTTYKDRRKNAFIFGASADRFNIDNGTLKFGRFYTQNEDKSLAQVAILGSDIASDFFGDEVDPTGKSVRVGEYNFEVIGVYNSRGSFGFSNDDQQVFIPLETAQKKLLGIDHLFYVLAQAQNPQVIEGVAEDMRYILRRNHDITDPVKDDFMVETSASSLGTFDTILKVAQLLLIVIAGISLVVGGVGIMNIMYVVVTERTSEIGLKKSLGAKSSDILSEFLVESILLTLGGGFLGVLVGSGLSFLIYLVAQSQNFAWAFSVPFYGIFLALGVSVVIGLLFGVFPAYRASRLDPIEALRVE